MLKCVFCCEGSTRTKVSLSLRSVRIFFILHETSSPSDSGSTSEGPFPHKVLRASSRSRVHVDSSSLWSWRTLTLADLLSVSQAQTDWASGWHLLLKCKSSSYAKFHFLFCCKAACPPTSCGESFSPSELPVSCPTASLAGRTPATRNIG